ncbi:hypothetical protein H0H87_004504 [Tephrocybe sp. NHM501043]|nr:hypothetical protein H0H87_004504 [Tephrocybe sp. NHM501043]
MSDLSSVRAEVKAWERSFKAANGRDPSIQDIKELPDIAAKYKLYKKLSKTAATSSAKLSSLDPPSTPSRSRPRTQLVQPRVIETTAPLTSFNPFSPQKKGKERASPVNWRLKPSTSPFKPKEPHDPFPGIDLHRPPTSSHTPPHSPPAASNAISRARKRLRGDPVSPSPNKEKRRRIGSQLTIPFTKLAPDSSDSEADDAAIEGNSLFFISDSPLGQSMPDQPGGERNGTRQKQFSANTKGKGKTEPSKRKKTKTSIDSKTEGQDEESDDDTDSLLTTVKIVTRSQARGSSQTLHGGDESDPDPIFGYSHRGAPRGHDTHLSASEQEGRLEVDLPDELRRVLAIDTTELKVRNSREERLVQGLVLGKRTDHYDPTKGGEIWDVGEDVRIDGEEEVRRDAEGEDDWEDMTLGQATVTPLRLISDVNTSQNARVPCPHVTESRQPTVTDCPLKPLVKVPKEKDWEPIFKYSERVRQITYNENSNNVAASIFDVLEECRPQSPIFPGLVELNWKVETPAGLARSSMFLSHDLRSINLEVGAKFPQLDTFLADMTSRTKLTSFSFVSPTSLPDSFTELLGHQQSLEKLVLMAPGALAPGVGRWIASLPELKSLRLDLTGRSMIAVEGFFDELRLRSGDSTPTSVGSTDSGVFSDEEEDDEVDFSLIRKSVLRLTGDLRSKGSFVKMRKLHLTGDVSNIAVFVKHLTSPLAQLELVIEDPPDRADWHDLSAMICEKFGDSLQFLRVTATSSSRFADLVRATSRAEPASGRLSLEQFTYLPCLTRLEFDLPESIIFTDTDIECLGQACPNLEVLKLCPLARFPPSAGAPKITLDSISHLISSCRNLHTVAAVVDATRGGSKYILASFQASSKSLLRLHVGHSWIEDSLEVAIFLSHIAPSLAALKWFQERNRPGFIEANARNWQGVFDLLPHLQGIRQLERKFARDALHVEPKITVDKIVDACIKTVDHAVHAIPQTQSTATQASITLVNEIIQASPSYTSSPVDATPATVEASVETVVALQINQGIDAIPSSTPADDAKPMGASVTKSVQALLTPYTFLRASPGRPSMPLLCLSSIASLFSLFYRLLIFYPLSLPSSALKAAATRLKRRQPKFAVTQKQVPPSTLSPEPTEYSNIPLDTIVVEVRH